MNTPTKLSSRYPGIRAFEVNERNDDKKHQGRCKEKMEKLLVLDAQKEVEKA